MISVIVLNWNGKQLLSACFDSLRRQTYKNFEVIMVDNNSEDGSVEFVKEIYPEIRVVALADNYGFAKGNNEGIKIANGKYIVLLNNDTKVAPDWLAELKKGLDEYPEVGFCASKVLYFDNPSVIDSAGDAYLTAGAAHKIGHLDKDGPEYQNNKFVFGASASSAIYRRSMLDKIGIFDEDYFHGLEDVDLSFRAQLMGFKCLYVANAIVYHKVTATMKEMSYEYVYYGQRNMEYVYFKNMPNKLLLLCIFQHLFYNVGATIYFFKKKRLWPFIMAKLSIIADLPLILKKRRLIQVRRQVPIDYLFSIMEKRWLRKKLNKIFL